MLTAEIITMIKNILSNKWFWIVLAVVIILLVIRRNWNQIKALTEPKYINTTPEPGTATTTNSSVSQNDVLEQLARTCYADIYDTNAFSGHDLDVWDKVNSLSDPDLTYMAKFYKNAVTRGTTLFSDLNDEYFATSNINTRVLARLHVLGLDQ